MITVLSQQTAEFQQFRINPFPFQATFKTPLKDLRGFVTSFVEALRLQGGVLTTDEVVFEPRNTLRLMTDQSLHLDNHYAFTLQVQGQYDVTTTLEAVLGDWIDFAFLDTTGSFALYADHDEYTTFYSTSQTDLYMLGSRLKALEFEPISNYTRYFQPSL